MGAFVDVEPRSYSWTRQHMANTWLDELPIDSIHCFTDRVTREGLFKDLRRELLDLGQSIPVHYVTSLA